MSARTRRTVVSWTASVVSSSPRRRTAMVVWMVTAVLAGFVWVTPAQAATAPVVTNPGAQASPTKVALSLAMKATGGVTPYSWSASGLPAGLSLNTTTGVISGTPTAAASATTTVTATDAAKLAHSVSFGWMTGVIVTNPNTVGTATGKTAALAMAARGGTTPYVWTASGLPTGLTINRTTGAIAGTANAAGTYPAKVTATDAAKVAGTASFTWNVGVAPVVVNPGAQASPTKVALSRTSSATGGTAPYVWKATGLPAGLTMASDTGVISGTPTTAGTVSTTVTVTDARMISAGASFSWTTGVVVTPVATRGSRTGTAVSQVHTAVGGTTPYKWSATGLPTGLTINATSGTVTGTPTTSGTYTTKVTATDAATVAGSITFTWYVGPAPAVTGLTAQNSSTGTSVSVTPAATGGTTPYAWTATSLPAGLSINATSGAITGIPISAGTSTVTVTATDAKQIPGSVSFAWIVAVPLAVTNPGAQAGTTGVALTRPIVAIGGTTPYAWTATGLPAGLSINATSGIVTGTPTTAGSSTVRVTAADAANRTSSAAFTWAIAVPVVVTNPGARTGTTGVAVSVPMTAVGGATPYKWSATGLPAGLSINATSGIVTGAPTTAGSSTVTVTATDTANRTNSAAFTWAVALATTVTNPDTQNSTIGGAVAVTITATGGTTPYAWTATGLPAGLSINATSGIVTGTPTTAGSSTVTVTATDAAGRTDTVTFTWAVALAAPTGLTAQAAGSQAVNLAWTAVDGAVGYYVYRDGALVAKIGTWPGFADQQLDGATTYTYQVKAVDAAAWASVASATVSAATAALPDAPINFARCGAVDGQAGCTYTASLGADPTYPDTGGVSLTDGVRGEVLYGPQWQGRNNVGVYSVTIDLGIGQSITEINSTWLQAKNDYTILPPSIEYLISADGVTFQQVATIARPAVSDANQAVTYRAVGVATTARYVRVELDGSNVWTMVDEVEIRGSTAAAGLVAPTDVAAQLDTAGAVNLTWNGHEAAAYQVIRNGELIATTALPTYVDEPRSATAAATAESKSTARSASVDDGSTYSYEIRAVDQGGRISEPSAIAAAVSFGSEFRVLQLNLCNSGHALSCYAGGRSVPEAKEMIADEAPDVVVLQEICEADLPELATAMGSSAVYEFEAVQRKYWDGHFETIVCKDPTGRGLYGIGIIARSQYSAVRDWAKSLYPNSMQAQPTAPTPDDSDGRPAEQRTYLCGALTVFSVCTTHTTAGNEPIALAQCEYLTRTVMPTYKQGGLPSIMGGDLNLEYDRDDPENVQNCVPAGFTRKGDDDVQHIMWSSELDFTSVETLDWDGLPWNEATDHSGFLAKLTYYGSPSSPSPVPLDGSKPTPTPSAGLYIPALSPVSTVMSRRDESPYGVRGAVVVDGNAYYTLGTSVMRFNLSTRVESELNSELESAGSYYPYVRASYGNTLFVTDALGVHAVNTVTGVKRLIMGSLSYTSVTVTGNRLFIASYDGIYQVDLATKELAPRLVSQLGVAIVGDIAADSNYVWVVTFDEQFNRDVVYLRRLDPATGTMVTMATMDSHNGRGAMMSAGKYLYATQADAYWNATRVVRINKESGSVKVISSGFTGISSIDSDGVNLFVADGGLRKIEQQL